MRIVTWNINSVRLRIGLLRRLMTEANPDVICLQETKTPDEHFPLLDVIGAGYPHTHIHGMKGYNGVAILSKHPFEKTVIHHRAGKEDCRHIAVTMEASGLKNPLGIHCLYIPAGGDEPDPVRNEKFAHKLAFVDEMAEWFKENYTPEAPLIALGDFNIAPLEQDVWSHKQLLNVVSHTSIEITKLSRMQESLHWHDAVRHFVPATEKCYTWWSYRNRDWKKSDRGRRLDHIWVTPPLTPLLEKHQIIRTARDWDSPSDHVPVVLDVSL